MTKPMTRIYIVNRDKAINLAMKEINSIKDWMQHDLNTAASDDADTHLILTMINDINYLNTARNSSANKFKVRVRATNIIGYKNFYIKPVNHK